MPRKSAGILMYRLEAGELEVFLVHPGGPFWSHKDLGAWSIPKGEYEDPEDPLEAARREFQEETGISLAGRFLALTPRQQPSRKLVSAWAIEGDCDPATIRSNTFEIEWPRGSGARREFPEVDRAGWFPIPQAQRKILKGQAPFLVELQQLLGLGPSQVERPKAARSEGPPERSSERGAGVKGQGPSADRISSAPGQHGPHPRGEDDP